MASHPLTSLVSTTSLFFPILPCPFLSSPRLLPPSTSSTSRPATVAATLARPSAPPPSHRTSGRRRFLLSTPASVSPPGVGHLPPRRPSTPSVRPARPSRQVTTSSDGQLRRQPRPLPSSRQRRRESLPPLSRPKLTPCAAVPSSPARLLIRLTTFRSRGFRRKLARRGQLARCPSTRA
jgi:hypothetical protein